MQFHVYPPFLENPLSAYLMRLKCIVCVFRNFYFLRFLSSKYVKKTVTSEMDPSAYAGCQALEFELPEKRDRPATLERICPRPPWPASTLM